jgi:hypothetical protein
MTKGTENKEIENQQVNQAPGMPGNNMSVLLAGLIPEKDVKALEKIENKHSGIENADVEEEEEVAEEQEEQEEAVEGADNKEQEGLDKKKPVKPSKKDTEEEEEEEQEEQDDDENDEGAQNGKKPGKKETPEKTIGKNAFGIEFKKPDTKNKGPLKVDKLEELFPVIKSEFGMEIKSVKDLPKFIESGKKWRADSQTLSKVQKERDDAVYLLENLPGDLHESVMLYYQKGDYTQPFQNVSKLDFSKPAEKQDTKMLVEHYFPGDFTKEDFEAETPPKELTIAIKASQKQYNVEKTTRETRALEQVDKASNFKKNFETSIKSSVDHLRTSFPGADEDNVNEVIEAFNSGEVMSLFYNNDGTVKPDALKKLLLANHAETLMVELMEIAQNQGESRANEDMVQRGPSKMRTKQKQGSDGIRKEVKEQVNDYMGYGKKKTF